jgi:NAD(P)-dependent dehydrogenase (short-subunit alcohol dehydrogenase family)
MKARREGAIVNISSKATLQPVEGQGAYALAKTALEGATRQLAGELEQYNIRVNCARPGWMWGPSVEEHLRTRAWATGEPIEALIAAIVAGIPLGVIPPDAECAKSVLFLVSDYARMITGVTLDVNGGELMRA